MKIKWLRSPLLLFLIITVFFFYKFFFTGAIPVPADLLISQYNPWKEYSYLGYLPGGYQTKLQYADVIQQLYPWKTFAIDLLKNGQIPLWNPYNFSGQPFLADVQSAVFDPFNLLYFLFSQPLAWGLSIVFQPFLALIGTYLYVRKIGLKKLPAAFSAISYGFCLFMSVFLEYNTIGHILSYLPFTLYSIELLLENVDPPGILLFVGSIVFTVFAGHIQIAAFNIAFIIVYLFVRITEAREKLKKTFLFLFLLIISFGISAVQVLPTLELISLSARIPQNYSSLIQNFLIQPLQTILFVSPDFFGNPATGNFRLTDSYPGNSLYIGIAPLILAVSSIFYFRKNKFVTFFSCSCLVLILFLFRNPFSQVFYKLNIPLFSTGSPSNAIYLLSFSLAILAGFGMEYLRNQSSKKVLTISSLAFAFILVNIFLLKNLVNIRNAILSLTILFCVTVVFLLKFAKRVKFDMLAFALIVITVFDLFFFFQKFNPFVPSSIIFPQTKIFTVLKNVSGINRVWGYATANIESDITTEFQIQSPDGVDPLYPKLYGEFIQSSQKGIVGQNFTNQTRSDAVIAKGLDHNIEDNPQRLRVLETLGTAYILDKTSRYSLKHFFPDNKFTLVYEDNTWRIFKDRDATPRAFFAGKVDSYSTTQDFENKLFSLNFNPANEILVENNSFTKTQLAGIGGKAILQLINYSPDKIIFKSSSDSNQILFLSDTYYPGWQAEIDGKKTDIIKADYAFRAIAVPKGTHTIIFSYLPLSFVVGIVISLASLITLFLLCILNSRRKYFDKS